jgi:HAD superfamily hydrolase (TIGR01490 family)
MSDHTGIAAFFDIDGTLYREGLITAMFKKLIRSEIIEQERWYNEVKEKYTQWDKRIGNYDDYLHKMAEIYIEAVRGLHKSQIEFIAGKVVEQNGDRVYKYTRDRISYHKEQGHHLITISGSPIELVEKMAEKHGFDFFSGTVYETDSAGLYTGMIHPMWDSCHKSEQLESYAKTLRLDLSRCYAYGDTAGDCGMFEAVGNPAAVNPTRELILKMKKDPAVAEKGTIVVERKDMIYSFGVSSFYID